MADNTVSHAQDAPNAETVSTSATITRAETAPPSEVFNSSAPHTITLTGGASLSTPLNTLEDGDWEINREEVKAWFDGTNDALPAGWSYSTGLPRNGAMSGTADATSDGLYCFNRSFMPVVEGMHIATQIWARAVDWVSGRMNFGLRWFDADEQYLSDDNFIATGVSFAGSYTRAVGFAVPPADAKWARFYLRASNMTTDIWFVDDCFCAYGVPGEVVDPATDIFCDEVYAGTSIRTPKLRLLADSFNEISLKPPASPASWTLTLPINAGSPGQVLQTDGSGVLSWVTLNASAFAIAQLLTEAGDTFITEAGDALILE